MEAPLSQPPAHTLGSFFGVRPWSWRPRTPSANLNSIRSWQRAASCLGKVCARPRARVCVCTRTHAHAHSHGHQQGDRHMSGGCLLRQAGDPCFPALGLDGTWKACPEEFRQIPGVNDSETCRLVVVERGSSLEQSRQNMPLNLKARIFCKIIQKVC